MRRGRGSCSGARALACLPCMHSSLLLLSTPSGLRWRLRQARQAPKGAMAYGRHAAQQRATLADLPRRCAHRPAQEYVNGQLKNKYGDAFIRGNNGAGPRDALTCIARAGWEFGLHVCGGFVPARPPGCTRATLPNRHPCSCSSVHQYNQAVARPSCVRRSHPAQRAVDAGSWGSAVYALRVDSYGTAHHHREVTVQGIALRVYEPLAHDTRVSCRASWAWSVARVTI